MAVIFIDGRKKSSQPSKSNFYWQTSSQKLYELCLTIDKGLGLGCLTLFSTIFQLYCGCQFYLLVEETRVPWENHQPVTDPQS